MANTYVQLPNDDVGKKVRTNQKDVGADTIEEYYLVPVDTNLRKLEWSSGQLIYLGRNSSLTAGDSDTDWEITKYTWGSVGPTKAEQAIGSWAGRAALF
jgi:hypothetical protein